MDEEEGSLCGKVKLAELHPPIQEGFQGIESFQLPNGAERHRQDDNHQEDQTHDEGIFVAAAIGGRGDCFGYRWILPQGGASSGPLKGRSVSVGFDMTVPDSCGFQRVRCYGRGYCIFYPGTGFNCLGNLSCMRRTAVRTETGFPDSLSTVPLMGMFFY